MSFLPVTVCFCDSVSVSCVPTMWVRHLLWHSRQVMYCIHVRGHSTEGDAVWQEQFSVNQGHWCSCVSCCSCKEENDTEARCEPFLWYHKIEWLGGSVVLNSLSNTEENDCYISESIRDWSVQCPTKCHCVLKHNIKPFSALMLHADCIVVHLRGL